MTKKNVLKYLYDLDLYDIFDGRYIDDSINLLHDLKVSYPNTLKFNTTWAGYDGGACVQIYEERLETDKEYVDRLKVEEKERAIIKKNKAKKEEKDRKEYERLKKKFEGT